MSRIGRRPIDVPKGVTLNLDGQTLAVKGPKGELKTTFHRNMVIEVGEGDVQVKRPDDDRKNRALHGLTRTLIANMVEGVTKGFEKKLKIEGLGFNGRLDGKAIVLSIGYANQIKLTPPEGVEVKVEKDGVNITVSGTDKQKVGQFAADIRAARKPEPYQGKGIRYIDEVVRRKEGKAFGSK